MLQLGNFTFDIDDYPSELPIGGSSLVSVTKFPGGRKSIQNFGAYDDPITLNGTFNYNNALDKTRAIDAMWRDGNPVQLVVGSLMPRWVVITSFKPVYKNDFQIDYAITLEPITSDDPNAILYGQPQALSSSTTTTTTTTSSTSTSTDTQSASPERTYTVQQDDTLWGIALQYYGDGSQYTKIADANNIKDPSSLDAGQQLVVPA